MYERKGGEKGDRRGKMTGEERWQKRKGGRRERVAGEKGWQERKGERKGDRREKVTSEVFWHEKNGWHQKRSGTRKVLTSEKALCTRKALAPEKCWHQKRSGTRKALAPEKRWHQRSTDTRSSSRGKCWDEYFAKGEQAVSEALALEVLQSIRRRFDILESDHHMAHCKAEANRSLREPRKLPHLRTNSSDNN